ncbi:MAG TPA: tRNA (adenosine(37)-N6)-dimethylallyltransferase MiaA [Eubacteriales bacterium]|nr:tRNA (adenosine(37)-N6)-dimethylallyltransferase MiaA [Clostridia bacterium]HRV72459.1 tRNA (adenosine(37)-N6)-dimethylallyltransferase MiaA [Eubacteriales bacterium]
MSSSSVIAIIGPTACGKTALSVALAKRIDAEIVSCDSAAVYKGLDIGTAKPTQAEQSGVIHHMLSCIDPRETSFSVHEFAALARKAIDEIQSRGKCVIAVGGSGMYLDAVLCDMEHSAPSDSLIRGELEREYDDSPFTLYAELNKVDPHCAERLHPNDKKRVVRAMEVYRITGKPFSELNTDYAAAQQRYRYDTVKVGLNTDREVLYARIDKRVDDMMKRGLLDEVKALHTQGLDARLTAMQAIGYAQLLAYLDGKITLDEAAEVIKRDSRRFAKRQLTWFNRDKSVEWFDVSRFISIDELCGAVYEYLNMKGKL